MEISCSGCGKRYKIPKEKLPKTGVAYITCPNCRDKIRLDAPNTDESFSAAPSPSPTSFSKPVLKSSRAEGFEIFELGTRTALVYCPEAEAKEQIHSALGNMGYEIREVKKASEVAARFKYHIYEVVLLYQKGPDAEEELREIIHVINSLEMSVRRQVFVVYVFLAGNRYDSLQAFNLSVDLTMTPLDISKLPEILPGAMEAKTVLYSAFDETRAKLQEEAL